MKCPRCQQESLPEANFCLKCGLPVDGAATGLRSYAELNREVDRLSQALTKAAEQQTATDGILRIISRSTTDVQPVFEAIADSAMHLFDALGVAVVRYEGGLLSLAAARGGTPGSASAATERFRAAHRPIAGFPPEQTVLTRTMHHVADVETDPSCSDEFRRHANERGFRSVLSMPMLRAGEPVGVIVVSRAEPGAFSAAMVDLLQTFADQAVIAIENVRLFTELQEKNRSLTKVHAQITQALDQQTATSEVLRAIAHAQTDAQPVFDTIVQSAARLCHAVNAAVFLTDDRTLDLLANYGSSSPEALATVRTQYPRPLDLETTAGVAILTRSVVHVPDIEEPSAAEVYTRTVGRLLGVRSMVAVPMLRKGEVVGTINLSRQAPGRFSDAEVELLKTFAAQAVIAIENVRLFTELQQKNEALTQAHAQVTDALEQQTATAEILRVIASSPTDVQPVFDVIARSAAALCGSSTAVVFRLEGDVIDLVAHHAGTPEWLALVKKLFPANARERPVGWAALERATLHFADIENDPRATPELRAATRALGFRRGLLVPMHQGETPLGVIAVGHAEPGPFSDNQIALLETFADQAVIAIENVRLFNELAARNRELTATSEILQVISRSPTDVQPVFEAIAESAVQLMGAVGASVYEFDGTLIHLRTLTPAAWPHAEALRGQYPRPPQPDLAAGRVILERAILHSADIQTDPAAPPITRQVAEQMGIRGVLWVPMLREGAPVGAIGVVRAAAGLFSDEQVRLLQTFADQAVLAIENVRLFNETKEALERQTATSEILRVVASSPTDVQPVLEAVVQNASRLCGAGNVSLYRVEGSLMRKVAECGPPITTLNVGETRPVARRSVPGRAIVDRATIHLPDHQSAEAVQEYPDARRDTGIRTTIGIPLLREGIAIGAFTAYRTEPLPFTDTQIALLQTFADQAVIAIENVRLFRELEARNRDLIATAEILQVIARSPTDVQPVFDTIAERVVRLCDGLFSSVFRYDGDLIHFVAHNNWTRNGLDKVRGMYPRPPSRETQVATAILDRTVVEVRDYENDLVVPDVTRALARTLGFRSNLAVPLMREGNPIGAISVARSQPGPFSDDEIALLQTFADQAVIAIENVRLFSELQEKNTALTKAHAQVTEALDQQTATAEILRVISQSPTDVQPVFDTIMRNAVRLCDAIYGRVFRRDGNMIVLAAHANFPDDRGEFPVTLHEATQAMVVGRVIASGVLRLIVDFETDRDIPASSRDTFRGRGARSILVVPMKRELQTIGAIAVAHRDPGAFSDTQIELLKTFADQAVIAIENVRLFNELQVRTLELTRSVGQLTALGEVGQAVSSTLELDTVLATIVARAVQLSRTDGGIIYEYDEAATIFHVRAAHQTEPEHLQALRATPLKLGEGALGSAAVTRAPVAVEDILAEGVSVASQVRHILARLGYRSLLAVPLLREDRILGGLVVWRREPGRLSAEVVSLLQTFATQSALAIQNARLFRELADKSRQLEVASQHKSEFLANMSHELRTPLNAVIGFSEVLNDRMFGELNEKQDEYLKDIHASGQHLLSLINDILDLSKIEAGKMDLELSDFDLPATIDNALMLVRERAGRRGIDLHKSVDERLGQVEADERKIRQVLLNLLSNAIKFTPEGGRIEVRAVPVHGAIEVSVSDTGEGIASEDQEAIFEEFKQVGTASKKVEGTGLGLALSRKFVELHGGRIWVQSQIGTGSTFAFTIPVRLSE